MIESNPLNEWKSLNQIPDLMEILVGIPDGIPDGILDGILLFVEVVRHIF